MDCREYLPICDSENRVIGMAGRDVIHTQGLLHRAVHVLVFNGRGDLYLQRRGPSKDTYPLHWDTSVGGHQGIEESAEETAHRELFEELGIHGTPHRIADLLPTRETGWEFIAVFTLVTEEEPRIDGVELIDGRWCSSDEIDRILRDGEMPVTPSFRVTHATWEKLGRPMAIQDEL